LVVIEIIRPSSCQHHRPMRVLSRFGPPIVLMAVVFVLSAQPDLNSGLGTVDLIGRKIIHAGTYGLLWWLWFRALGVRSPLPAALISIAYAISDEYHQSFVEGRHGSPIDVLIDSAGVAIAITVHARLRARAAVE
jgi:VanZ family protein